LETRSIPGPAEAATAQDVLSDYHAGQRTAERRLRLGSGVILFGQLFLLINFVVRLALLLKSASEIDRHPLNLLGVFFVGMFYDLVTASYIAVPMVLYLLVCPRAWFGRRWHRRVVAAAFFALLYLLWFGAVAEWLFWDEFGARFNFIAVDYLIYTTEVIGNIRESYSLPLIIGGVLAVAILSFWCLWRFSILSAWLDDQGGRVPERKWRTRFGSLAPFLLAPVLFTIFVNSRQVPSFGNAYNQELARNGIYSFFAAYRNNELNYDQFYNTLGLDEAFKRVRHLIASTNSSFTSTGNTDLTRFISNPGPEKRWNIIQITVESLSAEYLGAWGNTNGLTPNLDALAKESLFFTNFYATGTRTVRGMEALALSVPPTPGQSIVRRPHNEDLFSLGSVLRGRGYDTAFIYGGYGYFDNMNYFFSNNGYRIIDRASVAATNITFANVWGACDENVLSWSMAQADAAFARKQPFFQFVMTTSNHRPYTYPSGKIDIPSHTGREGGVKYTDYAIGQFIQQARTKPWFTSTLFVVVADHCAASAGRTDLPIKRYEIPLMIYNPTLVAPKNVGTLCSQIDYPPTVLGLLNWSYETRFFGKDILKMRPEDERAFIASYQKLGLMNREQLVVLKPVRKHDGYTYKRSTGELAELREDQSLIEDGIAYYETASYLFSHRLNGALNAQ
jgi:phosphoglycerol transferase MdoB-like AlkP superfamily enzyme